VIDCFEDLDRVSFLVRFLLRFLFCVDFGFGFDVSGGKKLLRFGAGLSAFSVIAPV